MKLNYKMSRLNPPKVMCVKLSSYTYLVHTGYSHIVVGVNVCSATRSWRQPYKLVFYVPKKK